MPGNLYGCSQPGLNPVIATNTDTVCNSGAETNFLTGALIAPGSGNWFILAVGTVVLLMGATAATGVVIGLRIGAGADLDTVSVAVALLTNNATIAVPVSFVIAPTSNLLTNASQNFNITVAPTAQNVTAKQVGSRMSFMAFRGVDA